MVIMASLVNTYGKYQELLGGQRAKTSRFFHGWTKAGRCEMVANAIFEKFNCSWGIEPAEKDLLLDVLNTEVLPKVSETTRKKIQQQLDRVLPAVNKQCEEKILYQKRGELEGIVNIFQLGGFLTKAPDEAEKNKLIHRLHTLFTIKLKGCENTFHVLYLLEKISNDKLLGCIALLNQMNTSAENVGKDIKRIQELVKLVPNEGLIPELLSLDSARANALIEMLEISYQRGSTLLEIIKKVPTKEQKETLIDRLHPLFVINSMIFWMQVEDLKEFPQNEILGLVELINCRDFSSDSRIRYLKAIAKDTPDLVRPIIALFKMVPAKAKDLLEILKVPGGPDAAPTLLDIFKKMASQEQKETLVNQIYTLYSPLRRGHISLPTLNRYLSSFQEIPEQERLDFIFLLNDLFLSRHALINETLNETIQFLKDCPADERKLLVDQVKQFLSNISPARFSPATCEALKFIKAVPSEMRNAFINRIPTRQENYYRSLSGLLYLFLFPDRENRIDESRNFYHTVEELPIQEQVTLLIQAQRCYAGFGPLTRNPLEALRILKERIPADQREAFIGQIPSLVGEVNRLDELENNAKLKVLLFLFQRVPVNERAELVHHLSNLRIPNREGNLERLFGVPADARAAWVTAMNMAHEMNSARRELMDAPHTRLIVNPADFSVEERNPTRPLLQLFAEIDQTHQFPRIRYEGSDGTDIGGLTRDFVTKVFQTLCHPDQNKLPLLAVEGRYLPKVKVGPETLSLEDQLTSYAAIGMLFARAINGDPSLPNGSVTTGTHFHPVLFSMIHALTPDEMTLIPALPEIQLKLARIYLKQQFPQFFKPEGVAEPEIDEEIAQLMNGVVSPRLQEAGLDADFFEEYHVKSVVRATLVIAKSMHEALALPDQWAAIVGNSPEVLRKKIEGSLTPALVISAFGLEDEPEDTRRGMIKRWIREASPQALENFVFSLTGSSSLAHDQRLRADLCESLNNPENAPVFHTCGQYMDLPRYPTYAIFKDKLEISIASSLIGGFGLA